MLLHFILPIFFFNDTATTEIYTLSLHDALPISRPSRRGSPISTTPRTSAEKISGTTSMKSRRRKIRSEEHTSELQSRLHLVCRLLLEKKKKKKKIKKIKNNKRKNDKRGRPDTHT